MVTGVATGSPPGGVCDRFFRGDDSIGRVGDPVPTPFVAVAGPR